MQSKSFMLSSCLLTPLYLFDGSLRSTSDEALEETHAKTYEYIGIWSFPTVFSCLVSAGRLLHQAPKCFLMVIMEETYEATFRNALDCVTKGVENRQIIKVENNLAQASSSHLFKNCQGIQLCFSCMTTVRMLLGSRILGCTVHVRKHFNC